MFRIVWGRFFFGKVFSCAQKQTQLSNCALKMGRKVGFANDELQQHFFIEAPPLSQFSFQSGKLGTFQGFVIITNLILVVPSLMKANFSDEGLTSLMRHPSFRKKQKTSLQQHTKKYKPIDPTKTKKNQMCGQNF